MTTYLSTLTGAARRPGVPLNAQHPAKSGRAWLSVASLLLLLVALAPGMIVFAGTTTAGSTALTAGLFSIFDEITGPAAGLLAGLMLVGGAVAWGFSERDDGMRKMGQLGLAGGLLVGSATLVGQLFGAGI